MQPAPRPLQFYARYDLAAKNWKASDVFDHRTIRRFLVPKVAPEDFLKALNYFHSITDLQCFHDAAEALLENNIINDAEWNTDALTPGIENLEERVEKIAVNMVRLFIASGMSRRLAMANTAANIRWPGNSFDAAVKSIERLCQDASTQKDRTKLPGKCPKT